MFASIKSITTLIEERIATIESNKTAPVEKDLILKANAELLNKCLFCLSELKRLSTNKNLILKYEKMIKECTII